jgi:hypothetical protein
LQDTDGTSHGKLIVHPAKGKFRAQTKLFELKHETVFSEDNVSLFRKPQAGYCLHCQDIDDVTVYLKSSFARIVFCLIKNIGTIFYEM